jgi:ABC-type spermidine/putrescine transport system permease subunit II
VITGTVVAIVSGILLIVVLGLDGFTAAVYSVGGKDIKDPTAEAQALREQYAGAKTASIVGLVVGLVVLAAGAVLVYFTRGQETDDDEDLGYDDLAGE